ncbi:MAG: carboxymuconolactone decarboxylase family protein, partial [Candidatus Hydrogenedentes bacterium]|nr:carboxymuconolactone decarboxylase family protein [Candidatus Hydrogenedentota bacterium]
ERLALAVAEANGCEYCVAAHTVLGKQAGLSDDDILASRKGVSDDPKSNAAMAFARALLGSRGHVTDGDVHGLRDAGFGDGEIAELVALVVLNLFTNYINDVAQTPLDFPQAPALD